jgi:hypothetical protein
MKTCPKCGLSKDEDNDFHKYLKTGKPRSWCKLCTNADNIARAAANPELNNARAKAWRDANPEKFAATSLAWRLKNPDKVEANIRWTKYRLDFDAMWKAQKGLCACCGEVMLPKGRTMDSVCVDHDHKCCPGKRSCGKCIRGLIHWRCNMVLGYVKDEPALLRSALAYLERWSPQAG